MKAKVRRKSNLVTSLGFVDGPRPQFNFPGAWLYSAGHAVLQLNDISQADRQQRPDSGVIDHIAFASRGFEATKQHLTGRGVPYRVNQVPNSTRWQIFLRNLTTLRSNSISRPRMRSPPECSGARPCTLYLSARPWSTLFRLLAPPVSVIECILADCARCIAGPVTF